MKDGFEDEIDYYDDWLYPDTEECRKDMPEGFEWTCCGRDHDQPGCFKSTHETDINKPRKGQRVFNGKKNDVVDLVSDEEE